MKRYFAGQNNFTEALNTDGLFLPSLALPIANTTGLGAELDEVIIGQGVQAVADIGMILQISAVNLTNYSALTAGTNITNLGAGDGLAVPVDGKNSRSAVVGASNGIQYAFNAAPASRLRTMGRFPFNYKYGIILDKYDLADISWYWNEALLLETLHASGTTQYKLTVGAFWKE